MLRRLFRKKKAESLPVLCSEELDITVPQEAAPAVEDIAPFYEYLQDVPEPPAHKPNYITVDADGLERDGFYEEVKND